MIRMYSRKYFCPICRQKTGKLVSLYSEKDPKTGERNLYCKTHGYQQSCNCSDSELVPVIEPD